MLQKFFFIAFILFALANRTIAQAPSKALINRLLSIDSIGDHAEAMKALEKIKATEKLDIRQQLEVNIRMLVRSELLQQFSKGVIIGNQSLALAKANKLDSMEGAFYEELGNSSYYTEQKTKAVVYYKQAIAIAHEHGYWYMEAACSNNMGAVLTDLKKPEEAEYYLLNAISLMEKNAKGHPMLYVSYRILGTFYAETKQYDKAEKVFMDLIRTGKANKDTTTISNTYLFYSDLIKKKGDTLGAVVMSEEALKWLRKTADFHSLTSGLRTHSTNLADAGRHKDALKLQMEAYDLMKKSFAKDLEKEISEAEVKYKTEQLRRDKELSEVKAKKEQQIYLLIFGAVLIVIIALFYILNQRKNTRQKIASQQQRLEAIIEGEEKERSRIAKDLHDGIVQDLTAIKLKVQSAGKEDEFLNTVSSDIDRAAREVRDIAYQMMPVALREYGLLRSLEDLLQKTLAPVNIRYEFEPVNITERLPEKIEVCLYRITQELLNNVVKHSKADFVSLVISKHHDSLSLIFEDNGAGFNQADVKKGIGMSSLSSRLEIVNGELKFESAVGSGTMAIIKIPF